MSIASKKISKFDATICQILTQNAQNSISAGAVPQTQLGEFTGTSSGRKLTGSQLTKVHPENGRGQTETVSRQRC